MKKIPIYLLTCFLSVEIAPLYSAEPARYLCVPEKGTILLFTDDSEYLASPSVDVSKQSFLVERLNAVWTTRGIDGHDQTVWNKCLNQYSCSSVTGTGRFGNFYQNPDGVFIATKPIQNSGVLSLIGKCTAL